VSDEHDEGHDEGHDAGPSAEDALHLLQQRLDLASEAAERLISEAAGRVTGRPPPAGWQRPGPVPAERETAQGDTTTGETTQGQTAAGRAGAGGPGATPRAQSEAELLLGLLRPLRDVIPPELQQRLGAALREVLLALRALIDWYLERTERRRREPPEVEDIPIS
jgi:hypothetical protein